MRRILRDKLVELVRGEEGVALVVTLAVFFFMYLIIAGIYAVGTQVRERIHLQNACDAAAYSAAVVQADTLSRIATVNRAMSWTYVQMTRRQMDYIVWKWIDATYRKYEPQRDEVRWYPLQGGNPLCPEGHGGRSIISWFIGSDKSESAKDLDKVCLNRCSHHPHYSTLKENCDTFSGAWLNDVQNAKSFYLYNKSFYLYNGNGRMSIERLKEQIGEDKNTIEKMNDSIHNTHHDGLADKLHERIRKAANSVINANLLSLGAEFETHVYHDGDQNEESYQCKYMEPMETQDEDRFLAFGIPNPATGITADDLFGKGSGKGDWFGLVSRRDGLGFERRYKQLENRLVSAWDYWAGVWKCWEDQFGWHHVFQSYLGGAKWHHEALRAQEVWDSRFDGQLAMPYEMLPNYFGSEGTITVGVASKNANPWLSVLGTISGGIFSAFDPYCKKTVVFASAKAGYRTYGEGMSRGRNYQIDWKNEKEWNLYTSDWDAVLMPVRMAKTTATSGSWSAAAGNFLGEWVEQLGVKGGEMRAGGDDVPDTSVLDELFEVDGRLNSRRWYASRAKSGSHKRGLVQTRWQVGRQGQSPVWDSLTDRMFH